MRPANAQELKRRVVDAFADAVYPGDRNIAVNPDHCAECRDTDEFFRGRRWRELAEAGKKLQSKWGGLCFLSWEAWRFYLPAYLLVGLGDGEYAEDASREVFHHLSPPRSAWAVDRLMGYWKGRATGFSLAQQECLATYALAFSEMEPGHTSYEAAATYWGEKAAEARAEQGAA